MANEITKVTDQNGVDHFFKDVAAFPRSEQAVLGAKNLITIDGTSSGIFTINSDKTVTVNGNGGSEIVLSTYKAIPSWLGNCYLSGGKSADKRLVIGFRNASDTWLGDIDNTSGDTKIIIPANAAKYQIKLVIGSGITLDNEVFYPMISFDGGEYAPPAMTNKQLTDSKLSQESFNVLGAKNIGKPYEGYVIGGDDTNGYYLLTNNTSISYIAEIEKDKKYRISKSASYGNRYRVVAFKSNPLSVSQENPDTQAIQVIFANATYSYEFLNSGNYKYLVLTANYNASVNFDLVEGMIALAGTDPTYVPYAMTNRALTINSLIYKGIFSNVDLNMFTDTGIYVLNGSLSNNPEGSNYGTMIVYPSAGGGIGQIYYRIQWDNFYTRRYYQGAWSNWYKYTGTELT